LAQRGADLTRQKPRREAREARDAAKAAPVVAAEAPNRRRMTFKDKHALETLPKTIAALHEDVRNLQTKLDDPQFYGRDRAGFEKVSAELGELQQRIAAAEEQWLQLEILREELAGS
jgi:ATP-binding cassette subfamily F protein uup